MRGATLIELLVGMLLAGLAVAGGLSGLAQAQGAWRDVQIGSRLHERAQYVFATLEPELQMAGYYGPGPRPGFPAGAPLPPGAGSCGASLLTALDPPLQILQGAWSLSCPAQGRGAVAGSDVLVTRRASIIPSTAADGAIQLLGSLTHPDMRGIYWSGAAPALPPTPGNELRELRLRIFYIARSADDDPRTPALRVKSLTAISGQPAFIDTEVMPGVEDLRIITLPGAAHSVQVRLRLRTDAADTPRGQPPRVLEVARRFTLRNAHAH